MAQGPRKGNRLTDSRLTVSPPAVGTNLTVREGCRALPAIADHLFASIMTILDPGEEPTATDLRRLTLIDHELTRFRIEMELRVTRPEGRA